MSVLNDNNAFRKAVLGLGPVSKASGTLTAATVPLFTIAGGEVLITGFWLKVTTSMTGANTVAIQQNPTTGDTQVLIAATDLGTSDTVTGSVIGIDQDADAAPLFLRGGRIDLNAVVTTGQIELVGTEGTINGAVTAYITWVPLVDGATLVAA